MPMPSSETPQSAAKGRLSPVRRACLSRINRISPHVAQAPVIDGLFQCLDPT